MKLKRTEVESYLHWHAIAAQAKEQLKELKPCILAALKEGAASPPDLPFLLEWRTSTSF